MNTRYSGIAAVLHFHGPTAVNVLPRTLKIAGAAAPGLALYTARLALPYPSGKDLTYIRRMVEFIISFRRAPSKRPGDFVSA